MFKNILVPVDLDHPNTSEKAMNVAKAIAAPHDGVVTVISVRSVVIRGTMKRLEDSQPKLDAYLASQAGDIEVRGLLRVGSSISGEIRHAAETTGADLIVMASHNPTISDYLIGSNAAHVVLHTPCSVMVVR